MITFEGKQASYKINCSFDKDQWFFAEIYGFEKQNAIAVIAKISLYNDSKKETIEIKFGEIVPDSFKEEYVLSFMRDWFRDQYPEHKVYFNTVFPTKAKPKTKTQEELFLSGWSVCHSKSRGKVLRLFEEIPQGYSCSVKEGDKREDGSVCTVICLPSNCMGGFLCWDMQFKGEIKFAD